MLELREHRVVVIVVIEVVRQPVVVRVWASRNAGRALVAREQTVVVGIFEPKTHVTQDRRPTRGVAIRIADLT